MVLPFSQALFFHVVKLGMERASCFDKTEPECFSQNTEGDIWMRGKKKCQKSMLCFTKNAARIVE